MRFSLLLTVCLAIQALIFPPTSTLADDPAARAAASRAAIKEFAGALKADLVTALKADGPAGAIEVCHQTATLIAADISRKKGWEMARTSLKLRNPANAPDAWEARVLTRFEARLRAGDNPKTMEAYEVVETAGQREFRYMKAIPVAQKPCLACHGGAIKPTVKAALDRLYPGDQATGYSAGQIRGAFTIRQPM